MEIELERDGSTDKERPNGGQSAGRGKIDFHHPYTPYPIQEDFMYTVYEVIEDGKIGILESPTGTVS